MNINILAIDIAKNHFHVHGADSNGKTCLTKSLTRAKLVDFIMNLEGDFTIAMEACGGSNHWGRLFEENGFKVKLISPQFIKGFLHGNKNDANDAKAIAMAAQHEEIRTVAIKTIEQQDLQALYRIRAGYVTYRTELGNRIRGILLEYGITIERGISALRRKLPEIITNSSAITNKLREYLAELYDELLTLEEKIKRYNKEFEEIAKSHAACQQFMRLRGVGPIIAVLTYIKLGNGSHFKNGRHFAAYLGLVPREHSTGGKHVLLGISKRGDTTLRGLLIHGARSVAQKAKNKNDAVSCWLNKLIRERGHNKSCVAYANKLARHLWAMAVYGERFVLSDDIAS